MPKLIIPGGSGFLGLYLAKFFNQKGWEVFILSRSAARKSEYATFVQWDGKHLDKWTSVLEGADAVVNMAGRTVNCRYNEENKRQILESRLDSTQIIGKAIAACQDPPKVWINSSSATIYKDTRGDTPPNDEFSERIGDDFSMTVCKKWEKAFSEAAVGACRKIALRTAIVIAKEPGGALEYLIKLTKTFLGGTQGMGEQFVSWVHLYDFARVVDFLIAHEEMEGVVNCAAPNPVTNETFMRKLREACGRSWGLPMPAWLLEVGAVFIRTQTELILKSRKVVSKRLPDAGFKFDYPTLDAAFEQICK